MTREEESVFAGTAVYFEDIVARPKDLAYSFPHSLALRATNQRMGEDVIIAFRDAIEGPACSVFNRRGEGGHASTSE
jgi:hypothetical protein